MRKTHLILILLMTQLIGCASQPVVCFRNKVYLGMFTYDKIPYGGAEYNSLRGYGLSVGIFAVGLGYYHLQSLEIDAEKVRVVLSPIADVWVNPNIETVELLLGVGGTHGLQ